MFASMVFAIVLGSSSANLTALMQSSPTPAATPTVTASPTPSSMSGDGSGAGGASTVCPGSPRCPKPTPSPSYTAGDGSGIGGASTVCPGSPRCPAPTPAPKRTPDVSSADCVRFASGGPCYAILSFSAMLAPALSSPKAVGHFSMTRRSDGASEYFRAATAPAPTGSLLGKRDLATTMIVTYGRSTSELVGVRITSFRTSATPLSVGIDTIDGTFTGYARP